MSKPTPISVPFEDDPIHTDDTHYFCDDLSCPCHEDTTLIADLNALVEAGEVSAEEATSIVSGKSR